MLHNNSHNITKILEIYTYNNGYKGGVATMVSLYIESKEQFAKNNCELYHLNISPKFNTKHSNLNNFIYIFTQRKEIKRFLKNNQYDIVHIHTSREFLFLKDVLLAKLIKQKFKIPIILTIHVGDWQTVFNRIGWFQKIAIHILNKYVDKTFFLSATMKDKFNLEGIELEKSTVLYNFHNIPYTSTHNTHDNMLHLLFVGAIHREKGVIELLTALKNLKDVPFRLTICGKITDKSNERIRILLQELENCVDFLGYVSGEKKITVFNNADVLILPSYHEGLPLVILEALGAGCAIISTRVGAIPEILSNDNVFWINPQSSNDIEKAIRYFASHLDKLYRMQVCNKELSKQYTLEKHINQLAAIYNKYGKAKSK